MHLGALLALIPSYFSWSGLAICFLLHWLTGGIGICLTYHRLLTHRSFALRPRWLEYPLTIMGTCASEGGPIGWVADHRRHHAFSDDDADTHTPNEGFFWAHMGWWMKVAQEYRAYARILREVGAGPQSRPDPSIDRTLPHPLPVAALRGPVRRGRDELAGVGRLRPDGLRAPLDMAGEFGHSHVGISFASTRDNSTNLWWVALLTYGEGWHNNHHAYQTSARHGLRWWEVRRHIYCHLVDEEMRDRLQHPDAQDPPRRPRTRDGDGQLVELIVPGDRQDLAGTSSCLPSGRMAKMREPWQSGPSSTAEQGTHQEKGGSGG